MELRKDPITRSWVVAGHREIACETTGGCPFCPEKTNSRNALLRLPAQGPSQVVVFPHPDPLFRVEGDPQRRADGIYDQMQPIGADEIVIETPEHHRKLEDLTDDQVALVAEAWRQRIEDLKRDRRFKYVSVYKNYGALAGQESSHANSQVTATTFMPRRVLHELRAAREWYHEKERCVFCDIVKQEERQKKRVVDTQGDYVALCPYASRVPYEVWLIDRRHNHLFEQPLPGTNRRQLAALLRRRRTISWCTLRRTSFIPKGS
jgi:UDPglucose--hexose-1-phosphate uridylyltransferase